MPEAARPDTPPHAAAPRVLPVDPARVDAPEARRAIAEAAATIRAGGLVAFPTETVYGLGADALSADAVRRIFAAKGRPSFNPVIAHLADADAARALVTAWPDEAERLTGAFWPGPLTVVLPKQAHVPDALTAGLAAVAVRVPAHPVALALVRAAGTPVAAPSANRYTAVSPTTAAHVVAGLGARVDLVLDGGPAGVGIESTVVDLTGVAAGTGPARVLRPGPLDARALAAALGGPLGTARDEPLGDAPRLAPGMVDRHYAPRAEVWLVDADDLNAAAARLRAWRGAHPGARAAALLLGGPGGSMPNSALGAEADAVERMPDGPAGYARRLYAALHAVDDGGYALVAVERPPDGPEWAGVRDRLARAAR